MYITVDCAPVILWICCHCGYWGMVHWLYIWNSQANFFLNHCWYVVLLKTVINLGDDRIVRRLKISPQLTKLTLLTHLSFMLILEGGCLQNWSSVNKPQGQKVSYWGQKCIVPGAEIHRTMSRGALELSLHIPTIKGRCARDTLHHTFNTSILKWSENNSTTIKHIYNESENETDSYDIDFDSNNCWNPINGVSDWHEEFGEMCSPSLHIRLLDTGNM